MENNNGESMETQLNIPPIAKNVIELLREQNREGDFSQRTNAVARQLLDASADQTQMGENGLTAYLIISHLGSILEPGVANQLQGVLRSSISQNSLVSDVWQKATLLDQEAGAFQNPRHSLNYYMVTLTGNPLGNIVLSLEARKIAKSVRAGSPFKEDSSFVVEPFTHMEKKSVGVWMSTEGKHFSPELIK